ncbi:hypothetical protein BV372_29170 [Nostoc sp. T09]|nr:hypothetical protein BV372_29170 [Nostoc sp. T09]
MAQGSFNGNLAVSIVACLHVTFYSRLTATMSHKSYIEWLKIYTNLPVFILGMAQYLYGYNLEAIILCLQDLNHSKIKYFSKYQT